MVAVHLGKEGKEARGGESIGLGAAKNSVCVCSRTLLTLQNEPMRRIVSKWLPFRVCRQEGKESAHDRQIHVVSSVLHS